MLNKHIQFRQSISEMDEMAGRGMHEVDDPERVSLSNKWDR